MYVTYKTPNSSKKCSEALKGTKSYLYAYNSTYPNTNHFDTICIKSQLNVISEN